MTAQVPDRITVDGETLPLLCNPLADYFRIAGVPSPFRGASTALYRGYVASWRIEGGRLWLTEVENDIPLLTHGGRRVGVVDLFPDRQPPIAASWYTGTLRIGRGDVVKYVHQGYASVFETEEYLQVRKGTVLTRRAVAGRRVVRQRARRVAGGAGIAFAVLLALVPTLLRPEVPLILRVLTVGGLLMTGLVFVGAIQSWWDAWRERRSARRLNSDSNTA
jgi:hypothetical protein